MSLCDVGNHRSYNTNTRAHSHRKFASTDDANLVEVYLHAMKEKYRFTQGYVYFLMLTGPDDFLQLIHLIHLVEKVRRSPPPIILDLGRKVQKKSSSNTSPYSD